MRCLHSTMIAPVHLTTRTRALLRITFIVCDALPVPYLWQLQFDSVVYGIAANTLHNDQVFGAVCVSQHA